MAKYGIPYQGSKQAIAESIVKLFPSACNFYDLFGGGFSITHCMLERRHSNYKQFHFNEIRDGVCDLVKAAIEGKYNYNIFKPKFIDRDMFFENKDKCAYTRFIWSFGNSGKTYLFGSDIEPYKKSLHNAVVFNEFDSTALDILKINKFSETQTIRERRIYARKRVLSCNKLSKSKLSRGDLGLLQQLQRLERLQQLEQLEQLERLQQLQQLQFYSLDYRKVEIKQNSIIYCDIPYLGTVGYSNSFNHKDFFDWADSKEEPVFISEYNIDDSRFKKIASFKKRALFSAKGSTDVKEERVFVNKSGFRLLLKNKLK